MLKDLHQEADFVPTFLVDVDIIVASGHLQGAFGQPADGNGDFPGHVKPQPDGSHQGDQGDDDQGQIMAHLDGAKLELALAQLLKAAGGLGEAQQVGLGDALAQQQVALEIAGGVGHRHLEIEEFIGPDFLPDDRIFRGSRSGLRRRQCRQFAHPGVVAGGQGRPVDIEDLQAAEVISRAVAVGKRLEKIPVAGGPVVLFLQLLTEHAAEGLKVVLQVQGEGAGQVNGLVQGFLHLPVPRMVHPAGNELPGHDEEEQGGQQGQGDEGEDQAGAQPGAEDLATPLQKELGQMAEDEEGEEQQEKGVDIEQPEGEQTAGYRLAALVHQVHFQGGDGHHQHQGNGDEGPFPALLAVCLELFLRFGAVSLHQLLTAAEW